MTVIKLGFITLLLKKNGATNISGFCPISLVYEFETFSKTMASQLAPKLAANQSMFIHSRTTSCLCNRL
jgi:hypothetical protein